MSDPLRVLLVSHSLSGGGAERFAATLARHMDRARFAPRLAIAVDRRAYGVPQDVEVHPLGYRGLVTLPAVLLRLRRLLDVARPDVVVSNVISTSCLVGTARLGMRDPPPWIARVGLDPVSGDPALQGAWARRLYPRAVALVSNSSAMAGAVRSAYPQAASRVTFIPNPTDFSALDEAVRDRPPVSARPGESTLLSMGRLAAQKRPDLAVDTLAAVQDAGPTRLWWAGEGPLDRATRDRARGLGVEDRLDLLGFLPNPFPLVPASDLFLLTSDFEGLPNALIETQGLGLPAVATRCDFGPGEIVEHGETGLLVEPGDRDALVRSTKELLGAPERRRALGAAARLRARQRYGLDAVMPRWENLLVEASRTREAA